jgi:site-specific DNA-methyltransferase (adenine-specific)
MRRPKIPPARCPHCQNLLKSYGGYKRFVTNGVNLSDVWDDLSPVRHRKYKTRAANELPRAIPERALSIVGMKGGVVVDPFAGAGTVLSVAVEMGMRFVACDRQMANCRLMYRRLT